MGTEIDTFISTNRILSVLPSTYLCKIKRQHVLAPKRHHCDSMDEEWGIFHAYPECKSVMMSAAAISVNKAWPMENAQRYVSTFQKCGTYYACCNISDMKYKTSSGNTILESKWLSTRFFLTLKNAQFDFDSRRSTTPALAAISTPPSVKSPHL